jgi:4-amino-4-deoxychorismate lyase
VHASPITPFAFDPTSAVYFNPVLDRKPSVTYEHTYTLHLDSEATPPSLFTRTKTTARDCYDHARARVGVHPLGAPTDNPYVEVVLHNDQDILSEASISNIAIFKTNGWITPPLSTGCLPGVMRRWLLQQGRIYEGTESQFALSNIKEGDWLLLFNGVQGCRLGQVAARGTT